MAARAQHARAAAARDEAALRVRAAKRPRTQADAEGEAAAKRLANTQRQRRLADAPEGQAAARRPAAATTPLTSAEARQQAEAEGLTLTLTKVQSATAKSATGFYGVRRKSPGRPRPYAAEVWRGGKTVSLGSFATAEEAALCVARSPEGQAAARRPAAATTPLTSAEARQQAEAEGLTLTLTKVQSATAKSATGFYGVRRKSPGRPRPYAAGVWRGGKTVSLGSFATAEEAALCVARSPEGQAAARRPAAATTPLTSAEARQQAEAEGLTLTLTKVQSATAKSATGFYGVRRKPPGRPRPYAAAVRRGGKIVSLGSFATAEEAALCVARSPVGQAAAKRPAATPPRPAAATPPLTSAEARQQAEAEGLLVKKIK